MILTLCTITITNTWFKLALLQCLSMPLPLEKLKIIKLIPQQLYYFIFIGRLAIVPSNLVKPSSPSLVRPSKVIVMSWIKITNLVNYSYLIFDAFTWASTSFHYLLVELRRSCTDHRSRWAFLHLLSMYAFTRAHFLKLLTLKEQGGCVVQWSVHKSWISRDNVHAVVWL
jgi:hypothetical protein